MLAKNKDKKSNNWYIILWKTYFFRDGLCEVSEEVYKEMINKWIIEWEIKVQKKSKKKVEKVEEVLL